DQIPLPPNVDLGDAIKAMKSLFFFSSRRRHTMWPGDWSSDVCSSDLLTGGSVCCHRPRSSRPTRPVIALKQPGKRARDPPWKTKIGRASCRERGEMRVGGRVVKKKKEMVTEAH